MINKMIAEELARSNRIHREFFASAHEGESVIREEILEAAEEVERVAKAHDVLFHAIRTGDNVVQIQSVDRIRLYASEAIKELLEVCAMCDKFKQSSKKEGWE